MEAARGADALGRLAYLAEAGARFSRSLDYLETLRAIPELVVPVLADWCFVYLVEEDGSIRRVTFEAADDSARPLGTVVDASFQIDPEAELGVPWVIRTGMPLFRPDATAADVAADVEAPNELRILLEPLGITSWICVPLTARGRTFGALSLVLTHAEERYDSVDLALAEELAARAALAVDNARLFASAQGAFTKTEESRVLLDAVLAASPVGLAFLDVDLRMQIVNQALASYVGSQIDRLVGRRVRDVVPQLGVQMETAMRRVIAEGEPALNERLSGGTRANPTERRDWLANYYPVRSDTGEILGVGVAVMEITELTRAHDSERSTRVQMERTAALLERLQSVTQALSSAATPEEIARAVVRSGIDALDASAGIMASLSADGSNLEVGYSEGYPREAVERWRSFSIDQQVPLADCVRSGELVVVPTPEERARRYPSLAPEDVENPTWACIPLRGQPGVGGAIGFSFQVERTFDDDERSFMMTLGEQTAQALGRARLYESERNARRRAEHAERRMRFLAEAGELLGSSLDYGSTLRGLAGAVVPAMADWCILHLVEDGVLQPVVAAHTDRQRAEWFRRLQERYPVDMSLPYGPPNVLRTGRTEVMSEINDEMLERAAHDEDHLEALRSMGMTSAVIVPLIARGGIIGTMTLIAAGTPPLDDAEITLAEDLARRAASAVDNARLFRKTEEAEREMRFRGALLEAQSEGTMDGILVVAPDGAIVSFNRRFVEMWGIPDDVIQNGTDDAALDYVRSQLEDPQGFLDRVRFLYEHPEMQSRDEIRLIDGRIFDRWSLPLTGADGFSYGRAWYFRDVSKERQEQAELIAQEHRSAVLADVTTALASAVDVQGLLRALADVVVSGFSDWCVVDLVRPDNNLERVVIRGRDVDVNELLEGREHLTRAHPNSAISRSVRRVVETGMTLVREDVDDALLVREANGDEEYLAVLRSQQLRSGIVVPMRARDRIVGAITFATRVARRLTPADVTLAEEIAFRTAAAIEHVRLYEKATYISTALQQSLLPPHLPDIPGVEVAARYRPAGEGIEVGGDFYDVFETARGDWAVLVGDVCGKGADAAATTALARHTIRAAAMQVRRPRRVLERLNDVMLRSGSRFCTVAYARVRPQEAGLRLTVACGGHPIPLVLRASGTVEALGAPGMLIGSFDEVHIAERSADLHPGDTLVLYTDGVLEARAEEDTFGHERLTAELAACRGADAAAIAAHIEETVLAFGYGRSRDDIAIVTLRVSG